MPNIHKNSLHSGRAATGRQHNSPLHNVWPPQLADDGMKAPAALPVWPRVAGRAALLGAAVAFVTAGLVHSTLAQSVSGTALGLICEMNRTPVNLSADTVSVEFSLTNTGAAPVRLLRWNTAYGDGIGAAFNVRRNGNTVAYEGPVAMRREPTAPDFLVIQPGERQSAVYDLTANYDVTQPGNYTVTIRNPVRDLTVGTALAADQPRSFESLMRGTLDCGGISFSVADGGNLKTPEQEDGNQPLLQPASILGRQFDLAVQAAKAPAYNQCSSSEQSTVKTAHDTGYDGLLKSYSQLNGDPSSGNELYGTWFGAFDASRFNTVKTNYSDMGSAATDDTFTYYCKPDLCSSPNTIAYTYKGSRKIFLCNAFWRLPPDSGFDTQAGTVVHEMSHAVSYTDDFVYGTANAKALARSKPNEAIRNADNYEYFTEDNGF